MREPALEMTALNSLGRMEFRLGRDRVLPCGYKKDNVNVIYRSMEHMLRTTLKQY